MSQFEPVNDNLGPPSRDRRREPRRRVLLTGKIVYPKISFSADCSIRDLSANGAGIRMAADVLVNDPFLIVVKEAVVHSSLPAWKAGERAGLLFLNSQSLRGDSTADVQDFQRIWLELMLAERSISQQHVWPAIH